ncbi:MAG: hypothetical protein COT81_04315 [Candidatus Buchananbacteria bacterium CG10_big_fil_rev_8_21_14_0_10_42_9]|uniref:Glycogen synthase n=1 Tax=Candidatus Buchananbacteria bacterium CG10_big_fil_rev_8_21_14_0_10_42_9 TaxID=1974526 RepID=A0A2H0W0G4_9BACT|nr:MAG: hypothetical protein COT81_04315 [Candidatus Buchananbacteria bacterium CG10_big_fil_rev_8_21_14_0_10_42_9]
MAKNKLSIVHITSEVSPFSQTGGLGDVARSLPKAIKRLGHEVMVITPLYEQIIDAKKQKLKLLFEEVAITLSEGIETKVNFWVGELMPGLKVYFVANKQYFGRKKELYGSKHENARFMLFDLAALKLLRLLQKEIDIIHCHDWPTGLVPYFLKKRYQKDPILKNAATIYTIHNMTFQLGQPWWLIPRRYRDDGYGRMPPFKHGPKLERVNFAKRAIINTDMINTVSEQYAKEILTKDFGQDLHIILKNRKDRLFGIVNGIDYKDYNPKTDPGLYRNYDAKSLDKKYLNKTYLQKYFKLPQNKDVPLVGMVTRVAEQKGFDLLFKIIDTVLKMDVQIFIMGTGDKKYEATLKSLMKKYPNKFSANLEFDAKRATLAYAGSDMFLMPSRFEPCGLGQLISLRYGSVPIVRATGGLVDTVTDFDAATGHGDGFVFIDYNAQGLLVALTRALETYKHKKQWRNLVLNGMAISSSWQVPAEKYVELYRRAIRFSQHNGKSNGKK